MKFSLTSILLSVAISILLTYVANANPQESLQPNPVQSSYEAEKFKSRLNEHIRSNLQSITSMPDIEPTKEAKVKVAKQLFASWIKGSPQFIQPDPRKSLYIPSERALAVAMGFSPDAYIIYSTHDLRYLPQSMNHNHILVVVDKDELQMLSDARCERLIRIAKAKNLKIGAVWTGPTQTPRRYQEVQALKRLTEATNGPFLILDFDVVDVASL